MRPGQPHDIERAVAKGLIGNIVPSVVRVNLVSGIKDWSPPEGEVRSQERRGARAHQQLEETSYGG